MTTLLAIAVAIGVFNVAVVAVVIAGAFRVNSKSVARPGFNVPSSPTPACD